MRKNRRRDPAPKTEKAQPAAPPAPPLWKRLLRAAPVILFLVLLMFVFAHTGLIHKLEPIVMDAQMRIEKAPPESPVVIVSITDEEYRDRGLFDNTSPLSRKTLQGLIDAIAAGEPAVIGVDIDTSARQFKDEFTVRNWKPRMVWEREVREIPENTSADSKDKLEPMDVLGGQPDLDPSRNTLGLPLLIDDGEDGVTRRYRRMIRTRSGEIESFPWAVVKAYRQAAPPESGDAQEASEDRLIHFSGSPEASHRLKFTASKVLELAKQWPANSPVRDKIVLLGGSYLDQDRHDTPVGRMHGVEVMANVIETELRPGGGQKAPGRAVVLVLELFESFALVLLFHALRLRWALLASLALVPVISIICSLIAFGNWSQVARFAPILVGLIVFELYEHFRRGAVPGVYRELTGGEDHPAAHH